MTIRNLDKMFCPQSVVLVGASDRQASVGRVLLDNFLKSDFKGPFAAINPHTKEIEGFKTVAALSDLSFVPDLAVVATPPSIVPSVIADLSQLGTRAAIVITAGFSELGPQGLSLQQQMLAAARPSLMRIIGPNCLGVLIPKIGLNASFSHMNAMSGEIALVSQSGAIVTTVLDWAAPRRIGFSHIVSLGGQADVDFGDMLDYLANDPGTRSILLYIEAIEHARKFMSAARHASRLKPVIVIKAGRHAEAAKAALSHTGALAGSDAVYQAAFERAGMLRVTGIEELFAAAESLSNRAANPLAGERLAIMTNGGGFGVLATDTLLDQGGKLAALSAGTLEKLDRILPATWSHANPVDMIGDANAERYRGTLETLLHDPAIDAVLVLNSPTAVVNGMEAAQFIADAALRSDKPVLTSWLGEASAAAARQVFYTSRIPTYDTQDQAISSFMLQVQHMQNQRLLLEIPSPASSPLRRADTSTVEQLIAGALAQDREWLDEEEAKSVLAAYGIPIVDTQIAPSVEDTVATAEKIGFPCAIKILSPDIQHKSDVGGVALNLADAAATRAAATHMLERVKRAVPHARIKGFTVQRMAEKPGAIELILGISEDRTFGPVLLFGQGGVSVEIVKDRAIALPPLNRKMANDLINRTRVSKLLANYRGHAAADIAAIEHSILALGNLAADFPQIAELDINPLWADETGVLALDARIRVRHGKDTDGERFAIKPYPSQYESVITDKAGTAYPLRPIKPEDAASIDEMLSQTDEADLRMRFLSALRALPRDLAARLSQIDYDREMAFVVFDAKDARNIIAVGRLSEDPDRDRAEYAVLVRTDHKGQGLGFALMHHLIDYARKRGVGEIFGHVLRENHSMLAICQELGFNRKSIENDSNLVEVFMPLRQTKTDSANGL